MATLKNYIVNFFKALIAVLIFGATQLSPVVGFFGYMIAPLLVYLPLSSMGRQYFLDNLAQIFLFNRVGFFGGVIFYLGFIVFCVSFVQWIKYYREGLGLFRRGLYSRIRHPQFLGIIIMTFGLTIKMLTIAEWWDLVGAPFVAPSFSVGVSVLVGLWFLQVLGYIAFASIEERSLSKKFGDFKQYTERVPFLLPIKNPKIIPEVLFTILLIVGLCVVLIALPYELIREFSYNWIPWIP